jgi:aspartate racemase
MPRVEPPASAEVTWPVGEGVLGVVGVAPWATLQFCQAFYALVQARKDWAFPRVLLDINTKIPSRGRHLQLGEVDPSPVIAETIRELAAGGATVAVVICNTAHVLFERWGRHTPIPVLHIVEETCAAARRVGAQRIAVLASRSLSASGLYASSARHLGLEVLNLTDADQLLVDAAIESVKVHGGIDASITVGVEKLLRGIRAEGADAVVAGCTELSILQDVAARTDLAFFDSNLALAQAALRCIHAGYRDA